MPLTFSDELLQQAGFGEAEARIEIACRLFEHGRLPLWAAAQWASLSRVQFEDELLKRRIPLCRPTVADLEADQEVLRRVGE